MDVETRELKTVGKQLEIVDKDCTIIIWLDDITIQNIKYDEDGCEYDGMEPKNFKDGEKTLVKNLREFCKDAVEMDFMDGTCSLFVLKNSFEVPLAIKDNDDIIHNNVPEWVQ